jgi:hypothetical protein
MFRAHVGVFVLSLCSVTCNLATVAHLGHFFFGLDTLLLALIDLQTSRA